MENKCVIKNSKTVDLFLFMGQSNMAGRGIVSEKWAQPAPQIMEGAGYEYRAISAPDKLYPLTEPFGRQENAEDGINDGNMKTGSLVTAFVNACYQKTGVPIVGVSASKGGSSFCSGSRAHLIYQIRCGVWQKPGDFWRRKGFLSGIHLCCGARERQMEIII